MWKETLEELLCKVLAEQTKVRINPLIAKTVLALNVEVVNVVLQTTNYDLFEPSPFNRDLRNVAPIWRSFEKYGWFDAQPMHVYLGSTGKLMVFDGHGRLKAAKQKKLPVKFVVCPYTEASIQEIASIVRSWTLKDYLHSHAKNDPNYKAIKKYHEDTGINLTQCIVLLCAPELPGERGSHHILREFKWGTASLSTDTQTSSQVASLVSFCEGVGLEFAKTDRFVKALRTFLHIAKNLEGGVDGAITRFKNQVSLYLNQSGSIPREREVKDYIETFHTVYNYKQPKAEKINLTAMFFLLR